jgi:guanosine-3',5'-bis(diphosphate) 3'-pyrophosphohydrolase
VSENLLDLSLLFRALSFAARKHRTQKRKDHETPYINHPLEVTEILVTAGKIRDAEVLAAAALHDTIEDTETSAEELRTAFGDRVMSLVKECTDDKSLPKEERKRLQVVHAPDKTPAAKAIKIADKISNMRDISERPPADWTLERKRNYIKWADEVWQGLKGVNAGLDKLFEETRDSCTF